MNENYGVSVRKDSTLYKYAEYIATYIKSPFGLEEDMFNGVASTDGNFTIKVLDNFKDRLYYDEDIEKYENIEKYRPEWLDNVVFKEIKPNQTYSGYYTNVYVKNGMVFGVVGYTNEGYTYKQVLSTLIHELTHAYQKLRKYEKQYSVYKPYKNDNLDLNINDIVREYKGIEKELTDILKDSDKVIRIIRSSYYYTDPDEVEAYFNTVYVERQQGDLEDALIIKTYEFLRDFWTLLNIKSESLDTEVQEDIFDEIGFDYFCNIAKTSVKREDLLLNKVSTYYRSKFTKIVFNLHKIQNENSKDF